MSPILTAALLVVGLAVFANTMRRRLAPLAAFGLLQGRRRARNRPSRG